MTGNANIRVEDVGNNGEFDIACHSGVGKRDSQQDSAYIFMSEETVFALVCDGMGGYRGGELASRTAVDAFATCFQTARTEKREIILSWITDLEIIDDMVFSLKQKDGNRLGAGTTLALAYVKNNKLYWLSVGDSRIYLSRGEEIVQVTRDHVYYIRLNQQLKNGELTQEEYYRESQRGDALISFVGMGGLLMIDVNEDGFPLHSGDTVLVCSDGVYKTLGESKIAEVIDASSTAEETSQLLENLINRKNRPDQDNYTYIIMKKK